MFIQIDNVGFTNKGAELMLYAIQERLQSFNNEKINLVKGKSTSSNSYFRKSDFFSIVNFQKFKIKWHYILDKNRLNEFGLVKKNDIDVLLDSAGFQFGDQWAEKYSSQYMEKIIKYYASYKKQNTRIIFLPQAFGPFNKKPSIDLITNVFKVSDCLFARDITSYNSLINIFGKNNKIRLAPDFTSLLDTDLPSKLYELTKDRICIIPNSKMISHTNKKISEDYINFLKKIINHILKKNKKITLLNHEGDDDWLLIKSLANHFEYANDNIITLNRLNAFNVKGVIGNSKLVISSRFHGLVSGLNQMIPTFCTSWSHKYEELLKDYDVCDNLISTNNYKDTIQKIDLALLNEDKFIPKPELISQMKERSIKMWQEITNSYL